MLINLLFDSGKFRTCGKQPRKETGNGWFERVEKIVNPRMSFVN